MAILDVLVDHFNFVREECSSREKSGRERAAVLHDFCWTLSLARREENLRCCGNLSRAATCFTECTNFLREYYPPGQGAVILRKIDDVETRLGAACQGRVADPGDFDNVQWEALERMDALMSVLVELWRASVFCGVPPDECAGKFSEVLRKHLSRYVALAQRAEDHELVYGPDPGPPVSPCCWVESEDQIGGGTDALQ